MTPDLCRGLLDGASLVYFDGRLTEAALVVAKVARQVGIPIVVEAERLRPGLELLMAEADFVVTSSSYPSAWTGEDTVGDAILATALRVPSVKWMVRSRRWPARCQCWGVCAQRSCLAAPRRKHCCQSPQTRACRDTNAS